MLRRPRRLLLILLAGASLCVLVWQSARMQSPLRRITNTSEEGTSINPSMSGDGRVVAFESSEDVAGAGGFESFRAIRANVSVDPAAFLQLGATRAPAPAVSQDGSRIVFASKDNPLGTNADANSEIFLHDSAKLIQLTNTSPGDISNRVVNGNFLPSISDDGRYVAFSSNRNLTTQNADGNLEIFIFDTVALSVTQLTNSSGTVGSSDAKISGNGAFVAYIRDATNPTPNPTPTPSARRDLVLQSRTGAAPLRVLATDVQSIAMTHGRAISDDGTRVVWAAETATNTTQVFLFDGRNNITRQITALGPRATDVPLHPTISGDGARIAFATRRSLLGNSDGGVDLYAFDIPSASFGRVTSGPSTATAEVLSSLNDDGSLIAFNFPRVVSGVSNPDFANNSEIYVTGTPSRPAFGTLTVINGASLGNEPSMTEAVAPDSIAVARGTVLGNTTERAEPSGIGAFPGAFPGTFPLTVGGTTVTVNGRRAQIIFVSPTQVNFLVPPETELGTAEVMVTNSDGFASRGNVLTLRTAPGVFTFSGDGLGDGVILDANTLLPTPFDPTNSSLRLIIFSTGLRNGVDISAIAGGRALTIESILPSPTMPGLDEIHVLVPADLRGVGKVDLVIRVDGRDSNSASLNFSGDAKRDIVINEFLADPPDGLAGDANKDGVRSTGDDEFVELVNTTTHDIDISGYQILTRGSGADAIRHTFAAGTILPACTAIVAFGGGNPSPGNPAFGGAQVLKASTGSLTLINSAGVITLRDQAATIVNFVSYGGSTGVDADGNQSVTRSPDTTGSFTLHQSAAGPGGLGFSPGTRIDGTPFSPCTPVGRVEVSPSSATVEASGQQQFTARAFDGGGNEVFGVIFSWQSSDTAVATIDQSGRATALAAGITQIRATGRGIQSASARLTVNPPTPLLTSVTISTASATSRVGETQQFVAQARDQFGRNIGGVTISFSSNNNAVATVDLVSPTSATGSATATLTGRASGAAQITATASTGNTNVSSSSAILTVEPDAGQLLISEFRTRGPNGASDEFIEIYNPTLSTVTIGGLKIRASNNAGAASDRVTIPAGTTLLSGRHYLVTNNTANTGYSGAVAGNQTYATGIADDGGIAITGSNGTTVIDAVGMSGGSAYKESTTLATLTSNANQSYERKPGGASGNGTDTNNNAGDFILNASSSNPQNLDSSGLDLNTAELSLTTTDSPDPVIAGNDLTYTITVSNNGPGTAESVVVTDNLPASVIFVSCSSTAGGACSGAGNNRTIGFSSLASGSSATITLVVTVNGAAGTTIANTALATSATTDPFLGNNSATASTGVQPPPSILSINDIAAIEGNTATTTLIFTVSSSTPAPAGGITFDVATQDNSATAANNDYVARSLTAQTIPAGQQTYAFEVTVNGDLLVEPNETFFVNVTNVSGATVTDGQGKGTIQNDDNADLVISQVYAGGGNSGAPFTNDFVELFNQGDTTVNFAATPYSIQHAGAAANFGSNKVDLTSGTIAPGKYFLVQLSSGGAIGAALPAPDAIGSINMAATAGKVSLVVGPASLPVSTCPGDDGVAPFNPNHATIVDFVGYGSTAVCYEGPVGPAPGPAAAPSATTADFRKAGGCTDTNDNAADLQVAAPAPRNSSSPANDCSALPPAPSLSINDVTVMEGNSGTTIATFTVSLSTPAPAGGVSFDIATADGSAHDGNPAGEDNDYVGKNLTDQTILAGNLAYTFEVAINGDLNVETNENFFVNLTNVSGATVADGQTQGTIQNDDTAPAAALTIDDVTASEGNNGRTTLTLTVRSSLPAPAGGITFDIATADGTAQDHDPAAEDDDYVARTLTAQTILAGQQTYAFDVTINGDLLVEPNEIFFVNLASVAGATVADGQGQGTIQNDDTANLVISQVYAAGGNSGAIYANDFVEIFNRGTTTVDFASTPYSIQYAGATANFGSNKVDLTSGAVTPGKYFLVQLSSGGAIGAALLAPDAGGSINLAATAGKVALVASTTALNAASCPVETLAAPVSDFIGYGTTAECFEGSNRAPAPGATTADFRKAGGCTDTDDNAADFIIAAPAPRNTGSPVNDCSAPPSPTLAISNVSSNEGNSGTTNFTFTVTLSSPAPAGGVSFNIATLDHSATVVDTDYVARTLTAPTILAGNLAYSFDVTVNGDLNIEPNENFFVNVTNVSGATVADGQGLGTIQNDDNADLVISQVYAGGGNSGAPFTNDFVELFNQGDNTVNFAATPYSIQYAGATANFGSNKVDLTSGTIAPGKYFLVQLSTGGAIGTALPAPDATGSINMAATAGKVSLVVGPASLPVSTCPGDDGVAPFNPNHATIVDSVGYGSTAVCYEGPTGPAAAPSATTADFRKAGGCTDNDDNAADMQIAAPAPRNTSSPANNCSAPTPTLTVNDVSAIEGNGGAITVMLRFKVALSTPAPPGGVSFDIATTDNSATARDGDYVRVALTSQTIPAGDLEYTFEVPVNGDLKVESTETFFVNLTNVSGANVGDSQGLGTIENDDIPLLTISDASAVETNSGTTELTFTVTSSLPASDEGITFDIATADGAAQDDNPPTEDNDYVAKSLTGQKITTGNTTYTFQVTVNGDTVVEPNETFLVSLTNLLIGAIEDGQGQGTIQNDDTANLVISQVYPGGGNSGAQYTNDFVEIFNPGDTATVSFAATPYSIQYAGATANFGSNKVNLTSGTIGPGKYFLVQLSSGGAIGAPLPTSDASGSINMAATAGKVALVVGTASLNAGSCPLGTLGATVVDSVGYGTTANCFEGSASAPAPSATTADFRKAGGCIDTNENANDFLVAAPFPRNSSSPTNTCVAGTPPNLTINDVTVTEGNAGTTIARFNVSLSAATPSTDVTFDIATQNNSATTANSDYTARTLTSQVIPAGQQTYTFDVSVTGDVAVEPDETFFVNVTNVTGATVRDSQGIGTIQHDDLPALSINNVSSPEGNAGTRVLTFIVGLSAPAPAAVTFDIATQDNTATVGNNDYVGRTLTSQTIATGNQNYSFDVTINGDLNVEPNESFFVNVTNVSGATVGDPQGLGTIQNDDSPMLSINDVSANETNTGTTVFTFTITSSLPAPAGGITFNIATADGSAQDDNPASEDNDYVARSLTGQTIAAGNTTTTFQVTVNGDTVVEPNETFLVNITNVSAATVADGQGQGTIQNDDTANLVISQVYSGGGNAGAQFRNDFVELFNPGTTIVNLAVTPYSIQYAGATANFGSNKTDLNSGTIAPGHYFLVQLGSGGAIGSPLPPADWSGSTNMAATAGKVSLVVGTASLPVSTCPGDNGVAPFNPNNLTIVDFVGYGATVVCYEGPVGPATGPAAAPSATTSDFRLAGGCTDTNDNANDFFVHTPIPRNTSSPVNNCVVGTPPNLTIDDVTVTEGNSGSTSATFTVSLSSPAPSADVTFDIATQNNTATTTNSDYVAKTLTSQIIPAGQQTYTFTVTTNGDTAVENDETFFVNATNLSGATLLDGQGVGTIHNDDFPTLSINDLSLTEGNAGTRLFSFTVSLSALAPTGGVTFDIATADGTAQDGVPGGEDNDYVARSLTVQTIPAGSQTYSFDVTVNGDLDLEPDETFFVNVTNSSGAVIVGGQGTGTIQNDDNPALSINDVVVTEGDAATTNTGFTVTLSPSSNQIVTVNYTTANHTAIAPVDYQTTSGMLTFNPGETSKPVNVLVNGDTTTEAICETFFVNLSVPTGGATISDPQGQGSITDNDGTKLVIRQIYGGGGNASATFANDFIEIFNRGNTAVSLNGMSVQYSGATSTSGNYSVTLLPNVMLQPGQYFLIQEASGGAVGSPLTPDATGTIAMAAGAGKVALVNGSSALAAAGCPSGAGLIDFVGYGTTANCREGASTTNNSPGPSNNTTSGQRKLSGCQDLGNNQQDFVTGAVTPRNTGTGLNLCSCSTSYSSMFAVPRFDSWRSFLVFLNEKSYAPTSVSTTRSDLINTVALAR